MKRVVVVLVVMMATLGHSLCSFAGMRELADVVESKAFWSGYDWDNFEQSELYKAVEWQYIQLGVNSNRTDEYRTEIEIGDLGRYLMQVYYGYPDKKVKWIDALTNASDDDQYYRRLVSWCDDKYGNKHTEIKQLMGTGRDRHEVVTLYWEVEKTRVKLLYDSRFSIGNNPPRCVTNLSFWPNKK